MAQAAFVVTEGFGICRGLCIKHGLFVPRQEVESLIRTMDSAGLEERKRQRLNRRKYEYPGPDLSP